MSSREGGDVHILDPLGPLVSVAGPRVALRVQAARNRLEAGRNRSHLGQHAAHAADVADDVHASRAAIHAGPARGARKEAVLRFEAFQAELSHALDQPYVELFRRLTRHETLRARARAQTALHAPVQRFSPRGDYGVAYFQKRYSRFHLISF